MDKEIIDNIDQMKRSETKLGDPATPPTPLMVNPELKQAFLEVERLAESEKIYLKDNMLIAVWALPFIKHLLGRVQQLEERTALLQGALSHLKEERRRKE